MRLWKAIWPWIALVVYLMAPLAYIDLDRRYTVWSAIGMALVCYVVVNPLFLGLLLFSCLVVLLAVNTVEEKLLSHSMNPLRKRVLAILIGVPIGLVIAWLAATGDDGHEGSIWVP